MLRAIEEDSRLEDHPNRVRAPVLPGHPWYGLIADGSVDGYAILYNESVGGDVVEMQYLIAVPGHRAIR